MVERSLSMREVPGSIPGASKERSFESTFRPVIMLTNLIVVKSKNVRSHVRSVPQDRRSWKLVKCSAFHRCLSITCRQNLQSVSRQRPYHVENTSSRPITEVKQHWARLVLGWVTAWEHWVLLSFAFPSSVSWLLYSVQQK